MNRRGFLRAILAGCAAPAIVRADALMRVVPVDLDIVPVPFNGDVFTLEHLKAAARQLDENMRLACNPPLIKGEWGVIERFTVISTPLLEDYNRLGRMQRQLRDHYRGRFTTIPADDWAVALNGRP